MFKVIHIENKRRDFFGREYAQKIVNEFELPRYDDVLDLVKDVLTYADGDTITITINRL